MTAPVISTVRAQILPIGCRLRRARDSIVWWRSGRPECLGSGGGRPASGRISHIRGLSRAGPALPGVGGPTTCIRGASVRPPWIPGDFPSSVTWTIVQLREHKVCALFVETPGPDVLSSSKPREPVKRP